ncbi:MAG: hypothetical protein U5Q44_00725 [Dehalococcoidia bacterium]|nr:hypothetical protein [Dehalococcoidia bacterium]
MTMHLLKRAGAIAAVAVLGLALAACGGDGGDNGNGGGSAEGYIATFEVAGEETYRILLTDDGLIEQARAWLDGVAGPYIPNGRVVRGETGVNEGWSWHIDPATVEFADMTMEVCDGLPSGVEDGTITSEQFCPWDAEGTVALEEAQFDSLLARSQFSQQGHRREPVRCPWLVAMGRL